MAANGETPTIKNREEGKSKEKKSIVVGDGWQWVVGARRQQLRIEKMGKERKVITVSQWHVTAGYEPSMIKNWEEGEKHYRCCRLHVIIDVEIKRLSWILEGWRQMRREKKKIFNSRIKRNIWI